MSPCSSSFSSMHHIRMSEKDNIKLRKPIVEKMRRDRINSCIEQLKVILEKEFHKQEPNSKLEKADILEMTVNFLRQQLQGDSIQGDSIQGDYSRGDQSRGDQSRGDYIQGDYSRGYSHCWRDSVRFLSASDASLPPLPGLQRLDQKQVLQRLDQKQVLQRLDQKQVLQRLDQKQVQRSSGSSRGPVWRPW